MIKKSIIVLNNLIIMIGITIITMDNSIIIL